jgi:hypothetical protein
MRCPKCGGFKGKYKVSRKSLWGHHRTDGSLNRKLDARTNFKAYCPQCGAAWEEPHEEPVVLTDEEH